MAQDNRERDRYSERGYGRQYDRQQEQFSDYGEDRYSNSSRYDRDRQGFSNYGSQSGDYDRGNERSYGSNDYGRSQYGQSDFGQSGYGRSDYDRQGGDRYGGSYGSSDRGSDRYGSQDRYGDYDRGSSFGGSRYDNSMSDRNRGFGSDYDNNYDRSGRNYGGSYDRSSRNNRGNREERGFFDKAGDEVASWFGDEDAERRRRQDHSGRGPANYERSNERLLEDACERLTHDRGVDASNINVTADNNEITLDGTVDSRMAKRRAEDCVHDISGVNHVQNNLRVSESNSYSSSGSTYQNTTSTSDTTTTS
ncbi:MAG: SWFGD domain-containing protein [Erythrobacter sp.]|nr:SWFGD domain-containing protein [Erythrobacter sp.]